MATGPLRTLVPWLLFLLLVTGPAPRAATTEMELSVATSGIVKGQGGERLGFVTGQALAVQGELDRFDVVFVVDVSGSTAQSSGADIDGDGKVGGPGALRRLGGFLGLQGSRPTSSGDSILAAEIASVRALLATLDPRNTRVALVAFAGGDSPSADNASLEVPLTSEFRRLEEGLDGVLLAGPEGATDMRAGLRIARSALRKRERGATPPQRHIVLLTDGVPAVPYETPEKAEQQAVQAARRLGREGVRVHAFAVGPEATDQPRACVEIARRSGGEFRAVENPGELPRLLPELRFASIEEVRVSSLDAGGEPVRADRGDDGRYSALLPLRPGENRIEVHARSSDGREKRVRVTIRDREPALDESQRGELQRLLSLRSIQQEKERRERAREIEIKPQSAPAPAPPGS
jgi:Mg-chelatase subunit ChlD